MKHIGIVDVTTVGACICANEIVMQSSRIGLKNNHPEFTLHALPFERYKEIVLNRQWDKVAECVLESIAKLKKIGADFIIIPANTIHYAIEKIISLSPLPVLNLVEVTVNECVRRKFKKVAILGTQLTMEEGLYNNKLCEKNITPIIPDIYLREKIQHLIFNEILAGNINPVSVSSIAEEIKKMSCDAVILGCTELPEVYSEDSLKISAIDTTRLLAHAALSYARE